MRNAPILASSQANQLGTAPRGHLGQKEKIMLYHIETTNGVLEFDRNDADDRSIKQYFADKGEVKPLPIAVRGYPFANMYLTHGTEENGLFLAVKSPK